MDHTPVDTNIHPIKHLYVQLVNSMLALPSLASPLKPEQSEVGCWVGLGLGLS